MHFLISLDVSLPLAPNEKFTKSTEPQHLGLHVTGRASLASKSFPTGLQQRWTRFMHLHECHLFALVCTLSLSVSWSASRERKRWPLEVGFRSAFSLEIAISWFIYVPPASKKKGLFLSILRIVIWWIFFKTPFQLSSMWVSNKSPLVSCENWYEVLYYNIVLLDLGFTSRRFAKNIGGFGIRSAKRIYESPGGKFRSDNLAT